MNDITQYGENELSLNVFNDEYLYNLAMRGSRDYLIDIINETFIYTDEQMDVLIEDVYEIEE